MTVKELIQKLSLYEDDMEVIIDTEEGSTSDIQILSEQGRDYSDIADSYILLRCY